MSTDRSMRGWVPDGCFLEIGIPVASAVAEATASASSTRASRAPILPRSITSSNFPGFALMDYKKRGQEEANLIKGEAMRIFKVYDHWCYVSFPLLQRLLDVDLCVGCQGQWGSWMGSGTLDSAVLVAQLTTIRHGLLGKLHGYKILALRLERVMP